MVTAFIQKIITQNEIRLHMLVNVVPESVAFFSGLRTRLGEYDQYWKLLTPRSSVVHYSATSCEQPIPQPEAANGK